MSDRFRILHLSDFHFSESAQWESAAFRKLAEAIAGFVSSGQQPDLVVVTGDVAGHGKSKDYEIATGWFDTEFAAAVPGLPWKTQVLFVPGNCDVDCDAATDFSRPNEDFLRERSDQDVANALSGIDASIILGRHRSYHAFANGNSVSSFPWWARMHDHQGHRIGIAGLASSLISRGASEEDYGKLVLTRFQVNDVFDQIREAEVRIALMHHPTSFLTLKKQEQRQVQARLIQECSLLLRGHLQHARSVLHWDPDFQMLELGVGGIRAGAGGHESRGEQTFQLIELDFEQNKILVYYRLWRNDQWIPDRNAYQAAHQGVAEFPLRIFQK